MPRAKKGSARGKAKRRVLRDAKGYRGGRSTLYRTAKEAVLRAGVYAFRDRRARKRDFRSLWVIRLSAACAQHGIMYSRFIAGLRAADIIINRKMLSEIAIHDPKGFEAIAALAKEHLPSAAA